MLRTHIASLVSIALFSLSCGLSAAVSETDGPGSTDLASTSAPDIVAPVAAAEPLAPVREDDRLVALAEFLSEQPTGLTPVEIGELAEVIVVESDRHDLDLRLVLALMYVESRYQTFAVSPVGAMGLMQVLPSTGKEIADRLGIAWYGPETLFDPAVNVRIGISYMKRLARRYGAMDTALAAYNWGPGNIDKFLRRGSPLPKVYPALVNDAYAGPIIPLRS
ncbi:MAG: lytic transglycosylase domain-containing protein [Myxococcales bacterium]|nr:lytic transglycosylase domain-containing protein [Myxococcales bacterium]